MTSPASFAQRVQLAQETRKHLVALAGRAMGELAAAVQERLTVRMNEAAPAREMQSRRDAWTAYQSSRSAWLDATLKAWQAALQPLPVARPKKAPEDSLELLGTEVVENKIIASRLVLGVMESAAAELDDLLVRIKYLEGKEEPDAADILQPEVLLLLLVEQWVKAGMSHGAWLLAHDLVLKLLAERLTQAYALCNAFLIKQGVLPTIELKDRVKRVAAAPRTGPPAAPAPIERLPATAAPAAGMQADAGSRGAPHAPSQSGQTAARSGGAFGGRLGWGNEAGSGASPRAPGAPPVPGPAPAAGHSSAYGSAADETRMMTASTPMARARSRALGVIGQLKRLLVGSAETNFEATVYLPPTPSLAAAIAVRARPFGAYAGSDTVTQDYSPAGVARLAGEMRQRTTELKNKAQTKNEKATIEVVALMFQAILQEVRIPPSIRVWFARLQMPVLRVALAEPDFFGTLDHPARQLIDRMGSCVMGFDATGINGSALELEIKRVVQVIEQYPETGKRVYQLVYEEFQKFLAQFLTGKAATQKLVSVAQQVEQKETLTIQYTIEMRNMLKDMPVSDEIREFMFKVWAEVLAMSALRHGPQHAQTLEFKKSATDLLWSASAKPVRSDRARVIQELPQLLQRLRAGMTLLGLTAAEQEGYIKTVSDTLADAFLSKTQAIAPEQIQAMAERLVRLEDFVSDDGMADFPLDAQSIELLLGIDASSIDVVADGGSKPTAAMLAWAQELQLGSWFTLDHNGRVAQVQFVWRSERKQLNLFAATDGHSYVVQAGRLAAYLQAGLLLPQDEEALTVRATRDALGQLQANPERLLG